MSMGNHFGFGICIKVMKISDSPFHSPVDGDEIPTERHCEITPIQIY